MRETGNDPMHKSKKRDDDPFNAKFGMDPMKKLGKELGQIPHSARSNLSDDDEEAKLKEEEEKKRKA